MPELPDITLYLEALGERIVGRHLKTVTLVNPFLLRTATPPLASVAVTDVRRNAERLMLSSLASVSLAIRTSSPGTPSSLLLTRNSAFVKFDSIMEAKP